jgi:ribose transport system substrate-binding protein
MNRICLVLALLATGFGCGPKNESAESGDASATGRKVIGASLLTQSHQFYQDLVGAMEEEAAKHNFTLRIQYAEFNSPKQINHLETFVQQGLDAVIVAPKDSAGIAPAIEEVNAAGIPVFTVDIAAHGVDVVSHIASDNVEGGRLIGEYLAKLLDGKGKVVIIDQPETASVQERVAGFEQALSGYPDMAIVQRVPGGGVKDKAMRATQDVLQANPELDAIFGINDDSALGALAAVESAGLQDKIVIVGYDGTPEARKAILAGTALKADTVQHPVDIGRATIETIAAYFAGEEVPKVTPVRVDIIDRESLLAEQNG